MKKYFTVLILLISTSVLCAQNSQKLDSLKIIDGLYCLNGKPYSGEGYALFPTGELGLKGQFVNGKKEGMWEYWYSSGERKRKSIYVNNKKHGTTYYWYKNGFKAKEVYYSNNKRIGHKIWDIEGNPMPICLPDTF